MQEVEKMDKIINNIYNVLTRERNNASDMFYRKFYQNITNSILTLMANGILDNKSELIDTLKELHPDNT